MLEPPPDPAGLATAAAELTFRELEATEHGLHLVAQMHYLAWQDCYAAIIPERDRNKTDVDAFVRGYKIFLAAEQRSLLVAELHGALVGMSLYGVIDGKGFIEALYLDVASMHRGYGKALLDEVLRRLDIGVTELECAVGNTVGQAFWERRGFRCIGEGDAFQMDDDMAPVPTLRYQYLRDESRS